MSVNAFAKSMRAASDISQTSLSIAWTLRVKSLCMVRSGQETKIGIEAPGTLGSTLRSANAPSPTDPTVLTFCARSCFDIFYRQPIFVAAAVDFEIIAGKRHGDLATRIAEDIKRQRRISLGLESPNVPGVPLPMQQTPEERQRRLLAGGTVLVGRPAFKEYMAGLRRGWTEGIQKVDREESLAQELENDGRFDEPEETQNHLHSEDVDNEPLPTPSRLPPSRPGVFSPLSMRAPPPRSPTPEKTQSTGADVPPPARIPPQPPLLLVPFVNHIGLSQIPYMILDFFNERAQVKAGAEAAYRLVMNETRPFIGPPSEPFQAESSSVSASPSQANTDLAFDTKAELFYKSSTSKLPSEAQKVRDDYYKSLPAKLDTARQLARREREPTSDEVAAPPPTEVELRAERLNKELRWRGDEKGWDIIRPDAPVDWDSRMEGALSVFVDPQDGHSNEVLKE